jgi:hypothetical protein
LNQLNSYAQSQLDSGNNNNNNKDKPSDSADKAQKFLFLKDIRGEILLRIAILKKEVGALDIAMQMCNSINNDPFNDTIKANALCLKVSISHEIKLFLRLKILSLKGILHEMRSEFPASEVVYRSVLQMKNGHATALERLGRVYLRFVCLFFLFLFFFFRFF